MEFVSDLSSSSSSSSDEDDDHQMSADNEEPEKNKIQTCTVRLGSQSLKAVNKLFDKETFEQYGGDVKILWKTAKNVMESALGKPDTATALHLVANLIYFESSQLEYKMFKNSPKFLSILEACGLISIEDKTYRGRFGKLIKLRKPGTAILEEIIREENKPHEEAYLRECFTILRRPRIPIETYCKYFVGLWKNILNHDELVREIIDHYETSGTFAIYCRDCNPDGNFVEIIAKTVERIENIFGELDERTFEFHFHKMELILTSDNYSNVFKLNSWKELSGVFERYQGIDRSGHPLFPLQIEGIGQRIYKIASEDLSLNDELKTKFLEESLQAFGMAWEFLKNQKPEPILNKVYSELCSSNTLKIWLGMIKCQKVLKKYDQTVELLREIYRILVRDSDEIPHLIRNSLGEDSDNWKNIFKEVIEYGNGNNNCDLEIAVIRELRILVTFILEFIVSTHKRNHASDSDILLYVTHAYLLCLNTMKDFDDLVISVQKVDEIWKEILDTQLDLGWWDNLTLINQVNHFFDFHKVLVKIVREKGIQTIQDKIMRESIDFSEIIVKEIFEIRGAENEHMTPYDYQNAGPSHIISCYMYLEHIAELIVYSSKYRQLIFKKFGRTPHDFASEWIMFLETLSEQVDSATCHVNVQDLVKSIESWAKKLSEETISKIGNEWVKSVQQRKADKLVEYCQKYISRLPNLTENRKNGSKRSFDEMEN